MHADPALRKLAARRVVPSMANLSPPVRELHGRVKCKHLQLDTLKVIMIAVPDFVRAVFHKKPGGMIDRLTNPTGELRVECAFILMHGEIGERREVSQ